MPKLSFETKILLEREIFIFKPPKSHLSVILENAGIICY